LKTRNWLAWSRRRFGMPPIRPASARGRRNRGDFDPVRPPFLTSGTHSALPSAARWQWRQRVFYRILHRHLALAGRC
jgi:hypothetical protein